MREVDPDSITPDEPLNPAWDEDVLRAVAGLFGEEGLELLQEPDTTPSSEGDELRKLLTATDAAMATWHEQASAVQKPRREAGIQWDKCVLFRLDELPVTVAMNEVLEILPVPQITSLPRLPDWLRGLCNLRGEIFSVVDFRRFLGLPTLPLNPRQRLMLVHSRSAGIRCGLIVDEILGIRQRDQNRLEPAPDGEFSSLSHWISGLTELDGILSGVLDMNRLMTSIQFRQLLPASSGTT